MIQSGSKLSILLSSHAFDLHLPRCHCRSDSIILTSTGLLVMQYFRSALAVLGLVDPQPQPQPQPQTSPDPLASLKQDRLSNPTVWAGYPRFISVTPPPRGQLDYQPLYDFYPQNQMDFRRVGAPTFSVPHLKLIYYLAFRYPITTPDGLVVSGVNGYDRGYHVDRGSIIWSIAVGNDISLGTHIGLGGPSSGRTGEDFLALVLDQARIACIIGLDTGRRNFSSSSRSGSRRMGIGRKCSAFIACTDLP